MIIMDLISKFLKPFCKFYLLENSDGIYKIYYITAFGKPHEISKTILDKH